MFFSKKSFKIFVFAALLIFFLGSFVLIQAKELEVDYPAIEGQEALSSSTTLPEYVKYIFNFAIALIGIFAFGGLIWAGILRITALGDSKKIESSRKQIIASILGLILLFSSYSILKSINPELIKLGEPDIEPAEITSKPKFEIPTDITSINVELPIETRVKGIKDEDFGVFEEKRLDRIEKLSKDIDEKAVEIKKTSKELASLAGKCKCDHGPYKICKGYLCSHPICAGDCSLVSHQEPDLNNPGETITVEECKNQGCRELCCSSDPCCCQRKDIDKNKKTNRTDFKEFQNLKENLNIERIELMVEVNNLRKTLDIIKNNCHLSGTLSRDNFISLKDYYKDHDWELKKVKYWDEVKCLLSNSYADFYCPIGGTRIDYSPPEETDASSSELFAELSLDFQEYINESGEFGSTISCQKPIPFGDVIDQGLVLVNKLLKQIFNQEDDIKKAGLIQLQSKIMEKVDEFHLLINECLSSKCTAICECVDPPCSCEPIRCIGGNPCPMGEINSTLGEIKDIQKEIEKRKKEIVNLVKSGTKTTIKDTRGKIQKYIEEDFDKMARGIHNCIAVPEEIAPGWGLIDCERAMGAIGPDGKILGSFNQSVDIDNLFQGLPSLAEEYQKNLMEDCECFNQDSEIEKCEEEFDYLTNKNKENHRECKVIDKCYEYNFFCCRIKD